MTKYDDYGMPVGVAYGLPESFAHHAWRMTRAFAMYTVKPEVEKRWIMLRRGQHGGWRGLCTLVKLCVVVWCIVVYWGERSAIHNSVDDCRWEKWENWVCPYKPCHISQGIPRRR